MDSGPAATLRELARPVARMETAANPIAATAIGPRHMPAFPDLVPFSSMTALHCSLLEFSRADDVCMTAEELMASQDQVVSSIGKLGDRQLESY